MLVINKVLALDVGEKRIGVAVASTIARLPSVLLTFEHNDTIFTAIDEYLQAESIDLIVVGRPRSMQGQETAQTAYTRTFILALKQHTQLPIVEQDETLTSRQAEQELQARGKPYVKGDIDALAALYILEDYLKTESNGAVR